MNVERKFCMSAFCLLCLSRCLQYSFVLLPPFARIAIQMLTSKATKIYWLDLDLTKYENVQCLVIKFEFENCYPLSWALNKKMLRT